MNFSSNEPSDDTPVLATYQAYNPAVRHPLDDEYTEHARTSPYSNGVHDIILTGCVSANTARPVTF